MHLLLATLAFHVRTLKVPTDVPLRKVSFSMEKQVLVSIAVSSQKTIVS